MEEQGVTLDLETPIEVVDLCSPEGPKHYDLIDLCGESEYVVDFESDSEREDSEKEIRIDKVTSLVEYIGSVEGETENQEEDAEKEDFCFEDASEGRVFFDTTVLNTDEGEYKDFPELPVQSRKKAVYMRKADKPTKTHTDQGPKAGADKAKKMDAGVATKTASDKQKVGKRRRIAADKGKNHSLEKQANTAADKSPGFAADKSPSVAANMSPSVAADKSPSVAADMSPSVAADKSPSVAADKSPSVAADMSPSVAADKSPSVAANKSSSVAAHKSPNVADDKPTNFIAAKAGNTPTPGQSESRRYFSPLENCLLPNFTQGKCAACNWYFYSRQAYLAHVPIVHRYALIYRCPTCKEKFVSEARRDVHEYTCTGNLETEENPESFTQFPEKPGKKIQRNYGRNRQLVILAKNLFVCDICKQPFATMLEFKYHYCPPPICEICGILISMQLSRSLHLEKEHGLKTRLTANMVNDLPKKCTGCNKWFGYTTSLLIYQACGHTTCSICVIDPKAKCRDCQRKRVGMAVENTSEQGTEKGGMENKTSDKESGGKSGETETEIGTEQQSFEIPCSSRHATEIWAAEDLSMGYIPQYLNQYLFNERNEMQGAMESDSDLDD